MADGLRPGQSSRIRLLGQEASLARDAEGTHHVRDAAGAARPCVVAHAHVWTTLGAPERDLFAIPEMHEPDRRLVVCGAVQVRASGLRLVENFLDMAHFPYVHADILGVEARPEVERYQVEFHHDADEVWATDCRFWQPQAAANAQAGLLTEYIYRIATPFNVLLYKTCASAPGRWDVIAMFVQPLAPDVSLAWTAMSLIDPDTKLPDLIRFQQLIFLQDRMILENQRPVLLPLAPTAEIPTRADRSSVAYRHWLKQKGLRFGVHEFGAA